MTDKPIIMRQMSLLRDFDSLYFWKSVWFFLMRSVSASVVLTLFFLVVLPMTSFKGQELPSEVYWMPLTWPICTVFFFVPFILFMGLIGKFFRPAHLLRIGYTFITVTIGDPPIWLLARFKPEWVPMHNPPFMSTILLWGIYDAQEVTVSDESGMLGDRLR